MKRTFSLFGGIILALIVGVSTEAACGGGGYSQSSQSTQRTQTTQGTQVTTSQRETRPASGQIIIRRMDTNQFDQQVRPRLNLSNEQSSNVDKLEREVKQGTDNAIAKSRSYDARDEFDKRLAEILTPEQFRRYRSMR